MICFVSFPCRCELFEQNRMRINLCSSLFASQVHLIFDWCWTFEVDLSLQSFPHASHVLLVYSFVCVGNCEASDESPGRSASFKNKERYLSHSRSSRMSGAGRRHDLHQKEDLRPKLWQPRPPRQGWRQLLVSLISLVNFRVGHPHC